MAIRQIQFEIDGVANNPQPANNAATVTGLTNDIENQVRMRVIDDGFTSAYSDPVAIVPEAGTLPAATGVWRFDGSLREYMSYTFSQGGGELSYKPGIAGQELVLNGKGWVNTLTGTMGGGLFCGSDREFTVSFWGTATTLGTFIARCVSPAGNGQRTFHIHSGADNKLILILREGRTEIISGIADGTRRHIAVTWDGTTAKAYVNGQYIMDCVVGTASENVGERITFGARTAGNPDYFVTGALDEVRIFNEALDASAILNLYNNPADPATPEPPLAINTFTGTSGNESAVLYWNIRKGPGTLTSVQYNIDEPTDTGWENLLTTLEGTQTVTGLTNAVSYDFRLKAVTSEGSVISDPVSVTPKPSVPQGDLAKYMEWFNEVPYHIDAPGFREQFRDSILDLVGSDATEINITAAKYFGINGNFNQVRDAFQLAINDTPVGGTLLIPSGTTVRLNNFTIDKNIRINNQGTIQRYPYSPGEGVTTSNFILRLRGNILFEGGTIDANRNGGWQDESVRRFLEGTTSSARGDNTAYFIQTVPRVNLNENPMSGACVVRNVTGINATLRSADASGNNNNNTQYGGFRIQSQSYFENVTCEATGGRSFSITGLGGIGSLGQIQDYRGVYLYKCNAKDYQRKGYDSGGTRGWLMLDDCKWSAKRAAPDIAVPEAAYLFETGNNNYNHTCYMKDCVVTDWGHSKSDAVKYVIMNNCTIGSYSSLVGQTFNVHINGVNGDWILEDSQNYKASTLIILGGEMIRQEGVDDGFNPVQTFSRFPIGENSVLERTTTNNRWKSANLHCKDTVFTYARARTNQWGMFRQIVMVGCTLSPSEENNNPIGIGNGVVSFDVTEADNYFYHFIDCTFDFTSGTDLLSFLGSGSLYVGAIKVVNPLGAFRDRIISNVDLRHQVQRNDEVADGYRSFNLGSATMTSLGGGKFRPPVGRGWKLDDRLLGNTNNYKCTQAGDSPGNAEFEEI